MTWSKLKTYLRKTAARITAALDEGWRAVSTQDARGYFAHWGYIQGSPK